MNQEKTTTESSHSGKNKSSGARIREMLGALRRHHIIHGVSPQKLKMILEDLGPTYVKIGQIMSMRSDILPKEYCDALTELRTDVKPMPYYELIQVVESEYGIGAYEIFKDISEECIGSASIAQVHKAILKDGRVVVLKVQRPGIYKTMERDIELLKRALSLIKILKIQVGNIDFRVFLDEMWATAQKEMDFIAEANYIKEFTAMHSDVAYVEFPKVEYQLTTPYVLVMEYIDGIQIDDLSALAAKGYDINDIGLKLAENYIKQILDHGMFHADPHPGNIYIREGKIIWLDLGMIGRISERDKALLKKMVLSIVRRDIESLKEAFITLDTLQGDIDHPKLYEDIENFLSRYGDLDLANIQLGHIMEEVKEVLDYHYIALPRGVSMLIRGIVTIEGVLAFCSPHVNFVQVVANHVSGKMMKSFDIRREGFNWLIQMADFGKNSMILPGQLADIFRMTMRGQTKIRVEVANSRLFARQLERRTDKMVIGILCGSLIIGSSLISLSNLYPKVGGIPVLGLGGFVLALLLTIWLIIKIGKKYT